MTSNYLFISSGIWTCKIDMKWDWIGVMSEIRARFVFTVPNIAVRRLAKIETSRGLRARTTQNASRSCKLAKIGFDWAQTASTSIEIGENMQQFYRIVFRNANSTGTFYIEFQWIHKKIFLLWCKDFNIFFFLSDTFSTVCIYGSL